MTDHNGVLMMQRVLLAGTLGLAMAQKAAAILEGQTGSERSMGARARRRGSERSSSARRSRCSGSPEPRLHPEPAGSRGRRCAAGDPGRGQRVPRAFR